MIFDNEENDNDEKTTFQDSLCSYEETQHRIKKDKMHKERKQQINHLRETYTTMEKRWKSCCFSADKGLIQFVVESVFAVQVILFCIVQMTRLHDCESQQLYSGILSLVIGILVPQPSINRHSDDQQNKQV
jgi:hypothetical protein